MSDLLRSTSLLLKLESLHLRMYFHNQLLTSGPEILVFELVSRMSNLGTCS